MNYLDFVLLGIIVLAVLLAQENGVEAFHPPDRAAQKIRLFEMYHSNQMSKVIFHTHFVNPHRTLLCPSQARISFTKQNISAELGKHLNNFFETVHVPLPTSIGEMFGEPKVWVDTFATLLEDLLMPGYIVTYSVELRERLENIMIIFHRWRRYVHDFFEQKEKYWAHTSNVHTRNLNPLSDFGIHNTSLYVEWPELSSLISMEVMLRDKVHNYETLKKLVITANLMVPYFMAGVFEDRREDYCQQYFKDQMHGKKRYPSMELHLGHNDGVPRSQGKMAIMVASDTNALECTVFNVEKVGTEPAFSTQHRDEYYKQDALYLENQYKILNEDLALLVKKLHHGVSTNPSFTNSQQNLEQYSHYQRGAVNAERYFSRHYFETLFSRIYSQPELRSLYAQLPDNHPQLTKIYNSIQPAIDNFLQTLENQTSQPPTGIEFEDINMMLLPNKVAVIGFKPVFNYTLIIELVVQAPDIWRNEIRSLMETVKLHEQYLKQWAKRVLYRNWFEKCKQRFQSSPLRS